ncbi:MAG: cold shock domain-containing protein [Melioribacteraceae bacterium]|nr:cold shock domain-containing protein [Melioribacteraceae bacterium]
MNRNIEKKVLDFCRVKKIFEKGFGFLTSLYHYENVFFHFSKIKDEEKREALSTLKRGVVSVFYTSKLFNGKRKVDKIWLNAADVPENLISDFIGRLLLELKDGKTNPFEIIDALNQLRKIDKLTEQNYSDIIASEKIQKNPHILLKLISDNEKTVLKELVSFLDELNDRSLSEAKHVICKK